MKLSRPAFAAVLSASLVLAACSGTEDEPQTDPTGASGTGTSAPTSTPSPTSEVGTATETATQSPAPEVTSGPTSEPTESPTETAEPTEEATGAVTLEEADAITQEVLEGAAAILYAEPGDERNELLRNSYVGSARDAVRAQIRLLRVTGSPEGDEPDPVEPTVLAISQPVEGGMNYIVAQTVPDSEIPRLHLLASDGDVEDFRIIWEGDMLPGARIGQFDRRSEGSPVVESDSDLGQQALEAHEHLAELLDYPHPDIEASLTSNGYTREVRDQARQQAGAVSAQAEFTQSHAVREDEVHTIELADGSALSFAVTERTSSFDVRDGMLLNPPETFRVFVDDATLADEAELDWLLFTVMTVAPDSDNPVLVGVSEQIVDASGS